MPKKYNEKKSLQNQKAKIIFLTSTNPKKECKKQKINSSVSNSLYKKHMKNIN
tara:strand:+ start:122 stop:280 length:159 start_codon:yes stop_codon:yes gene_type:complete